MKLPAGEAAALLGDQVDPWLPRSCFATRDIAPRSRRRGVLIAGRADRLVAAEACRRDA
jgi:hypothetical protein